MTKKNIKASKINSSPKKFAYNFLTYVFLSALNCEQTGKRTIKSWKIGIFGIISTEICGMKLEISLQLIVVPSKIAKT